MTSALAIHDGVAVIALDNPPVNGLSHALRCSIVDAVAEVNLNENIVAAVLIGAALPFSGGADITEFGTPKSWEQPDLVAVIEAVEASAKPVVAAIAGVALGGGLELALGCHARVALRNARVGLPEVKLGLLPGAGGTQRLPRLVGVETALDLITSGRLLPAGAAELKGMFAALVEPDEDLLEVASSIARSVARSGDLPSISSLPPAQPRPEIFDAARARLSRSGERYPALPEIIAAVEAATVLDFAAGMEVEKSAFKRLIETDVSKALRHGFLAERRASHVRAIGADVGVRRLDTAAVIGAGLMGTGIAQCLAAAGIEVTLLETSEQATVRSEKSVDDVLGRAVAKGRLTAKQAEAQKALIRWTTDYGDLRNVDIAIEAVFESLEAKRAVFEELDRNLRPGAILASNTSTLDLNAIAAFTQRPADVVGTHFFSPANVMRLLEVVRGDRTAPDVVKTAMQFGRRIGKVSVLSGVCDGFIGNRMVEEYFRQAMFLVEEGALPFEVDEALEEFGFSMGPFKVADLAGLDIGWSIRKRRAQERPDMPYSPVLDGLCEQGRFGQKTKAGVYLYADGRTAVRDPEVERSIAAFSQSQNIARREISKSEIVDRCVLALVNEGAKILEEGIAQRASDIDVVYLAGYGFPDFRGGPMFHADSVGLDKVVERMTVFERLQTRDPAFWRPAPLLQHLVSTHSNFADWTNRSAMENL
ncbi:3-hydroxyacyl-CoA dehydrogenase [Sphingobium indicum]|uniref:3-hydroxyacyl-CoA dehydrogenase n=2 Tax=Sphingobium indicum TaxID=332055 RepID=A0A1L5BU58_SPHIB|nr:3-hydroxyacyl-CoA dehydrogenase NAD-binding domain-containing protein [Sphingobium indicum]APL96403.1 3-hydroxyacyl-CoA dehydrogenase [Sphingobium indicum B90A]KEZ00366.1 3-hydroxyacyl-CoA dehydrogenase [Sphingomonas sp. BHC-A]RYM00095.1 3-hydroxyacyl-CoA dehydrogenase [Sphingobium indicum]